MRKIFIGIDISKDKFDYCILSDTHQILQKGVEFNDVEGIDKFCELLKSFEDTTPWISMEHTGHYGYLLISELSQRSFTFSLLSPLGLKKSMGLVRGKSDPIDAYRIASYALTHQHTLVPSNFPIESLRKLKVAVSTREALKKESVSYQNRIKALRIVAESTDVSEILKIVEEQLEHVRVNIKKLEDMMKQIIKESKELNESYKLITSVVGIGIITACNILVETENFVKITDPRKFACHSGVAPFPYSSGSSVRGVSRTSYFCKRSLKGILYKAAATAIQHDPELKAYYKRKTEEGKHNLSALNAVANKLILRVFAVRKANRPYEIRVAA